MTCARHHRWCSPRACRVRGPLVRAYDPIAGEQATKLMPGVVMASSAIEAVAGSDAIVLVTEWPEFAAPGLGRGRLRRPADALIVDGRNFLDGAVVQAAGFTYEGIGR